MALSEKGDSMDATSGSVLFWQDKAADRVQTRPNWQTEIDSDAKMVKTTEQRGEKLRGDVCPEKAIIVIEPGKSATSLPSNVGFGPWVNLSSARKSDVKPEAVLSSKNVVGNVTANTQEDNFHPAFSFSNSVPTCIPLTMAGDVNAPTVLNKSPLSPVHMKPGLPPRPPSLKTPGFHPPSKVAPSSSGMSRMGFHQFVRDVQPNRQHFPTPSNREAKQFVGWQDMSARERETAEAVKSESYFQKVNPSEQSLSDCGQQLFGSSYNRMGNSNLPVSLARSSVAEKARTSIANEQPIGSCSDGAAVQFENGKRTAHEDLHVNIAREGMRETMSTNLASDGVDLHLKVSVPGMVDSKAVPKNGSCSQTKSMEPNKTTSPGVLTTSQADASALTSAGLPWEMFIEPAGASRKAREQFVEVYNRARDELKNQKKSQTASRALARELDGSLNLTLGAGDATSEHLEVQSLKHDQHLAGQSQAQGRHSVLTTSLEHRIPPLKSSLKEQHLISLVERKGPVTTLANEQSGLHGVLDTSRKQTDGFRQEMTQLSIDMVAHTSDQQITCQRLGERSAMHTKGVEGQSFSSALAVNTKELASKMDEGNGAKISHQFNDRKESSKRSHAFIEENPISRVSEKGAVSHVRPQRSSHVWLQRWHPMTAYNFKSLSDTQVPSDGEKSDSVSYLAIGLKKFKDGDGVGVFSRSKELKNVSDNKETGVKSLKMGPSKMVPSAAAMAIVGTAARQYCAAQPQRKGSFAFWSGYAMPPPHTVQLVQQEKGKDKMFFKVDTNIPHY